MPRTVSGYLLGPVRKVLLCVCELLVDVDAIVAAVDATYAARSPAHQPKRRRTML